jgi:hypothetical protein
MLDISNNIFYYLSTVAEVSATILGFFIVGQIYFYGMMQKAHEKNKVPVKPDEKGICLEIVISPEVKKIYRLLIVIIFLSVLGILFNFNLETSRKLVLIISIIVLILFTLLLYKLYNYIMVLENSVSRRFERKREP